ncbi:hypothetical protein ACGC1H_000012 [Rhizoctonia solani]
MPIKHKSTPGPRGESCLTCRQRRKKCDKGRPFCQRCLDSKAKFICLGYDDESEPEVERPCTRKARPRTGQVTICPPLRVGVQLEEAVPGPSTRTTYFGTPVSAAEINEYLTPSVDLFMLPGSLGKSSLTIGGSTPNHDQGAGWKHISPRRRPNNAATLPLSVSIPRGVNANKQMRESYVFFILEEYQSYRVDMFFRSSIFLRGLLMAQTKRPRVLEFVYLGAKVFETFSTKSEELAIQSCSHWLTRYVNHVVNPDEPSNPHPSTQEVADKLTGLLEWLHNPSFSAPWLGTTPFASRCPVSSILFQKTQGYWSNMNATARSVSLFQRFSSHTASNWVVLCSRMLCARSYWVFRH